MSSSPSCAHTDTHTRGCESTALCFCPLWWHRPVLHTQPAPAAPTGTVSHWLLLPRVPLQTLLCQLPSSLTLRASNLHQTLQHRVYLPQLQHSEQMTGVVFLKTFSAVLFPTWRLNPRKITHRMPPLIQMVSYNFIHPSATYVFDHARLGDWFLALVASLWSLSYHDTLSASQASTELLTLMLGGLKYLHTAPACCFIFPSRALSKSQCSLKGSLPGSLASCWVASVTLYHRARHAFIRAFLLLCPHPWLSFAARHLRYLCRVFCPDISIWPIPQSSCSFSAPSGALGAIHNKKGNTPLLPLPHLLCSAMCWSSPALPALNSKSHYSGGKQVSLCLSQELCVGTALPPLRLMLLTTPKNGAF